MTEPIDTDRVPLDVPAPSGSRYPALPDLPPLPDFPPRASLPAPTPSVPIPAPAPLPAGLPTPRVTVDLPRPSPSVSVEPPRAAPPPPAPKPVLDPVALTVDLTPALEPSRPAPEGRWVREAVSMVLRPTKPKAAGLFAAAALVAGAFGLQVVFTQADTHLPTAKAATQPPALPEPEAELGSTELEPTDPVTMAGMVGSAFGLSELPTPHFASAMPDVNPDDFKFPAIPPQAIEPVTVVPVMPPASPKPVTVTQARHEEPVVTPPAIVPPAVEVPPPAIPAMKLPMPETATETPKPTDPVPGGLAIPDLGAGAPKPADSNIPKVPDPKSGEGAKPVEAPPIPLADVKPLTVPDLPKPTDPVPVAPIAPPVTPTLPTPVTLPPLPGPQSEPIKPVPAPPAPEVKPPSPPTEASKSTDSAFKDVTPPEPDVKPVVPPAPAIIPAPAASPTAPAIIPAPAPAPVPAAASPAPAAVPPPAPAFVPAPAASPPAPAAAFPPAPATTPPASKGPVRTDVVVDLIPAKPGQTYETISQEHCGTPKYADELRAYNRNRDPARDEIELPPTSVLRKLDRPATITPAAGTAWQPTTPRPEPRSAGRQYTVPDDGMTFRDIAQDLLQDRKAYKRIADLNPTFDPNVRLKRGDVIAVP